ncbi:beta-ketoacyl-[acyl-carrier-protein] synthase II, partial [bacterium]|nr:beta-ketoacyl-[acyl-carrier-protein] synthase II [bacterium]
MSSKRVVVTGLGAITPVGNSVPEYWDGLVAGRSGAGPITRFDPTAHKVRFACEVKNFDPLQYMDRKEAKRFEPFVQYAIAAAKEALRDSGLDLDKMNREDIGVLIGSG